MVYALGPGECGPGLSAAWSAPEMVNKEETNAPVTEESVVAKKPARKPAVRAVAKVAEKAAAAVKKPAAKRAPKSVEEVVEAAEVELRASTKKAPAKKAVATAAKKAPAKRASAKSAVESEISSEVGAPAAAPLAPISATSLMFMAPDLPTPVIDAKRGRPVEDKSDDGESHRRTRTRRRAGEEGTIDAVAPNAVATVRTPREPKELSNEPTRVKGSTRLEAKKQRRRDGRDAGRRRTVITES